MKIAIDISQIPYDTGVSKYTTSLISNLIKIDMENKYLFFAGAFRRKQEILKFNQNAKVFPLPPRLADFLWNRFHLLTIEKLIGKVDLIHTSDWAEPPSSLPKITTIHDLAPLLLPRFTPKVIVEAHKRRLKWVKEESKIIIVPSQSTKDDLIKMSFDTKKIRVIYEAPNIIKARNWQVENVKRKYSIHDDYIISIGTNPRKNLKKSIEAYHLSKHGKNLKYIIVGEKRGDENINDRGVRFLGHVPDGDLSPLLTGAKLLLFASLYEGLGVPILEGFNCGVPVVTSNISSMPEVAGGAAILVDPYDVNSIVEGIEVALSKPKTLVTKGLKRVQDFSWRKTAEETLEVYKEVLYSN
jgi:glycosyltransferase involved in cell wall biosynthesis